MVEHKKLWKHGNSVVMTIPAYYLEKIGLMPGDYLMWDDDNGKVILRPCVPDRLSYPPVN